MSTRTLDLETLSLGKGNHPPDDGLCMLEAVARLAGEQHTDHPETACPVISAFCRRWNDDLDDDDRQALKPYIPRLVGTRSTEKVEEQRAWLVTDWLVRIHTPAWLDLGGMKEQADALRALPALDSAKAARSAKPTIESAQTKAAAAGVAAWAAAWDAAVDAARAAAGVAAWDAAGDAAWDAARAAAGVAAGVAAWDAAGVAAGVAARAAAGVAAGVAAWVAAGVAGYEAARAKLKPTEVELKASAFDLLDRLIALGQE